MQYISIYRIKNYPKPQPRNIQKFSKIQRKRKFELTLHLLHYLGEGYTARIFSF